MRTTICKRRKNRLAVNEPKQEVEITICKSRNYRSSLCENAEEAIVKDIKERGMGQAVTVSYADFSDRFHEPVIIINNVILRGKDMKNAIRVLDNELDDTIYSALTLAKKDFCNARCS